MTIDFRQLQTGLTHQPLPDSWTRHDPALADIATIGELITIARNYDNPERATRTIRALITAPHTTRPTDPRTVALLVLLPQAIRATTHPHQPVDPDHVATLATELTIVIGEVDPDATNLYGRILGRACRRIERADNKRRHDTTIGYGTDPGSHAGAGHDDVANAAIHRVELAAFVSAARAAVASGGTSDHQWRIYQRFVLATALTGRAARHDTRRCRAALQPIVEQLNAA